jgi:hydroxypyruvate isomerase
MKLSACIENTYMFNEYPELVDRIRAVKAAGLDTVEFHMWADRDLDAIDRALKSEGVKLAGLVVNPRCGLIDETKLDFFVEAMTKSIAATKRLGGRGVVVAGGPAFNGETPASGHISAVKLLRAIAPVAEREGITIWLENLNSKIDHKSFLLDTAKECLDILDEVNSPAIKLMYDAYHSVVMGESPRDILCRAHRIGHIQVADTNGRREPGTGTIDWADFMATLKQSGYQGDIGLEYRPSKNSAETVADTRRVLGM